ncbi:MAG: S4 domain-containing protein YaaA [Bacilli bacterium]|nr:S4 domain-containing protein YaaA [Bacilli bacterium]
MVQKNIKLRKDEEYITLGVLLKIAGIIDTGGQAKYFLSENVVLVNDEEDNRRGRKLYHGDRVQVQGQLFLID